MLGIRQVLDNIGLVPLSDVVKSFIKDSLKIQALSFAGNGEILIDGALRKKILFFRPGTDAKVRLGFSLVDESTVRIRILSATSGLTKSRDLKGTLYLGAENALAENTVPPDLIRFVDSGDDDYFEAKIPERMGAIALSALIVLQKISTEGGALTIELGTPDLATALKVWNEVRASAGATPAGATPAFSAFQKSGSAVAAPDAGKVPTALPVPDVKGDFNLNVKL